MNRSSLLLEWFLELGPWLRRSFWHPLRQVLQIFHFLPLLAAIAVFGLLAGDGQLREIYLSCLEDIKSNPGWSIFELTAAAAILALISAVLFESHFLLSTMRINVIYSSNAKPGAGHKLRALQRNAAIALALAPWTGVAVGLFRVKIYLADTFVGLVRQSPELDPVHNLPTPSRWAVVGSLLAVGLAAALYVEADSQIKSPQRTAMALRPVTAALFASLLADALPTGLQFSWLKAGFWQGAAFRHYALWGAGIALATLLFYFAYHWLHRRRLHFLYAHPLHRDTGVYLGRRQRALLFCWALLPWLIVAIYFCFPHPAPNNAPPTAVAVTITAVAATGLLVALLLYRLRESARLPWIIAAIVAALAAAGLIVSSLNADAIIAVYRFIGPLATLALGLLFIISTFVLLAWLSVSSGFPALMLVSAALIVTAIFPVSIGMSAWGLGLLCTLFGILALVSRLWAVAGVAFLLTLPGAINAVKFWRTATVGLHSATSKPQTLTVQQSFECWLDLKGIAPKKPQPADCTGTIPAAANPAAAAVAEHKYPVFIIAAEGGGIYAASAAALLLAKLQDRNASFAEHVFAISGVSGGAIGAAIFQALERATLDEAAAPNRTATAPPRPANNSDAPPSGAFADQACEFKSFSKRARDPNLSLTDEVSAVMKADHFSPVVAAIYPEILGFAHCARPDTLAASFEQAVNSQDGAAARMLAGSFAGSWSQSGKMPALVLNSTWAETGFRVAFAPFGLHAIDNSLYSFDDAGMPIETNVPLMNAAVVSARFPAILPPYAVAIDESKDLPPSGISATMRWNFVDGGYSDSSGAETALSLYKWLKPVADAHMAELHVILLTSSDPPRAPSEINGTTFGDTVAPINAILNVRLGLGNEAVARACDGVLGTDNSACSDPLGTDPCQSSGPEPDLQIVAIPDQTYKLPLGWKLSQTTFNLVRWMIGTTDATFGPALPADAGANSVPRNANPQPSGSTQNRDNLIVRRNSCVLSSVLQTLSGWQQWAMPR